jgi:NAD(P)-dependent dehydrogenase (short-subunit alcohol dehydrogenase family)
MGRLDGKAVVVTGAGGTLGRAYALALAREGARIVANDLREAEAHAVAEEIEAAGGAAVVETTRVESWAGGERIIGTCLEHFGRIDGLITSAHRTRLGPIWELEEKSLDRTLDVQVKGHFACVHHAARAMREQGSGSILTVTSRALNGLPSGSTYAAAKGAIMSATFSWALELAESGVRVNAINPTAMLDAGEPARHMQWHWEFTVEDQGWTGPVPAAETVAPLAVYLMSDDADWITGQVLFLSGDTLALLRHPREERFAFRPEGWSLEDLRLYFRETIGAQLEMPGMGVPRYRWYDGVGSG